MVLAGAIIALIVVVDLMVANTVWRIVSLLGACLTVVAIVFLLPTTWRKRLGPVVAVFVTAAGTLSAFLVNPPADPVVDAQQMADAVAEGPFDQKLRTELHVGLPERVGIGDASAAGKLVAVQVPVEAPGYQIFAEVEVYPTAQEAAQRGLAQLKLLSTTYMPPAQPQTIGGFYVLRTPWAWVCGGVRGHAYAETTLTPGDNADLPVAQEINSALLRYADNKAKLATHPG
jgi:hypothetical protein